MADYKQMAEDARKAEQQRTSASTGDYRNSYIGGEGKTYFFPVEYTGNDSFTEVIKTVWTKAAEPKAKTRAMISCIIVKADYSPTGLQESHVDTIQFFNLPKQESDNIIKMIVDEDEPAKVTTVDADGNITYGDYFTLDGEGVGTARKYQLRVLRSLPKDLPKTVKRPDITLAKFAELFTAWQLSFLPKDIDDIKF